MVFEWVKVNVGDDCNQTTGIYVCPQHGIYMFSATPINLIPDSNFAYLMHGTRFIATLYGDDYDDLENRQTSISMVIECGLGEEVYVFAWGATTAGTDDYNMFSGVYVGPV